MDTNCKHKYVFLRNDSFKRDNGRYAMIYTSIDYYFCEKCLMQREVKTEQSFGDYEEKPDWAKLITRKIHS
jgi:hypothetical protein